MVTSISPTPSLAASAAISPPDYLFNIKNINRKNKILQINP